MREVLRPRRHAITITLDWKVGGGNEQKIPVTFGFSERNAVKEVFCLANKSGTDLQNILHHTCIAISVGLQHGMTMAELTRILGDEDRAPASIIGAIVKLGASLDAEFSPVMEAVQA